MKSLTLFFQRIVQVLGIVAVVLTLVPAQIAVGQSSVTQWGIWERSFTTSQTHAWHAFPVRATFTHSGGTTLTVDGYYDGENGSGQQVWTVRFTPTRVGTWTWATTSSDASLRASGSLQASAPTAAQVAANPNYRGHLRVATSGPRANRYFEYADGTPFFWLGDTVWDLNSIRAGVGGGEWPNQNLGQWLFNRRQKGFSVALTQLFYLENRNEGGYPFPNNTSISGNGDFSVLNGDHFKSLDTRLNVLHTNGLVVAAHPSWVSAFKMSLTDVQRVSRYLLARYGAYNIVWSLSGEYQQKYAPGNTWDDASTGGPWAICWNYSADAPEADCEWNQLGRAVAGYNAYGHPLSIHPGTRSGPYDTPPVEWGVNANLHSSAGEFHTQGWLDHNWLQTGQFTENLFYAFQRTVADQARTPAKPVVHSEGFYENEKDEGAGPAEVRWQAWTTLLNGAAGHIYGAGGVYQFFDPRAPFNSHVPHEQTPWQVALGYPGAGYLRHVRDFFAAIEWWKLEPRRDSLRVDGAAPASPSASDLTAPHAAAISNQLVVVYIPRGNASHTLTVTGLGGTYVAQAFNPRLGTYVTLNNGNPVTPSGGAWTIPAGVFADDDDWVVKLTAGISAVTPAGPPFNALVNFQPAGPTPSGMMADTGAAFGNRGNGFSYGWNADNSANVRARNDARSPDARYDTLNHTQLGGSFTWELAVPNGTYTVRLVAGDATTYNSVYKFNVEGVLAVEGVPTDHVRWIEGLAQVTVSDGRLTVSNAPGASLNKLAFVEITGGTAANPPTATPPPAGTPTATATGVGIQDNTPTPASSATPTNSLSDHFNRPDSADPGANWVQRRAPWSIASGELVNTLTGEEIIAAFNSSVPADASVSADFLLQSGGAGTLAMGLRWNNWNSFGAPDVGYNVDLKDDGRVLLVRNGDWATLGSYSLSGYTPGTTVRLTLRAVGSNLSVEVNGITRITATDATHSGAGVAGLWSDDSTAPGQHRFDNFLITPQTTATNTAVPPTATVTSIPPTATATVTSVPATATHTAVPPTATRTSIPPTATPTQTVVPPATNTPIPPTAIVTLTSVPPTLTAPPESSATPAPTHVATYEGEAATLNGEARVLYSDYASGGALAGWIGNGPDHWVEFRSVVAATSGEHTLTLHYLSAEPRSAYVSVNGGPGLPVDFLALPDWTTVGTHELTVTLSAGLNTIRIYHDTAYTPGIDRITVAGASSPVPTATQPAPTQTPPATATPAPTSTPPATPSVIKINFQKANATVPEGYLPDTGRRFGSRGNGYEYGWNADNRTGRDRDSANSPDQRYDTFVHMQRPNVCGGNCMWEIQVPNGTYTVRVVAGDPSHFDSVYRLSVEGVPAIDGTPSQNQRWFDNTVTVTVSDGRLTLSNAAGAQNNKVNFIEITTP